MKKLPSWVKWKTIDASGNVEYWELKPSPLEFYGMWYRRFCRKIEAGQVTAPTNYKECIEEITNEGSNAKT